MTISKTIEEAFQRHPRPHNVPTKAALLQKSFQKEQEISSAPLVMRQDPWKTLHFQGDLVQGKDIWSLCIATGQLVMVRRLLPKTGKEVMDKLSPISNHPNVATVKQCFEMKDLWYLQYEYSRFTLEEVLNVHLHLEESHIRIIASLVILCNI
jgi:hypothetical protein